MEFTEFDWTSYTNTKDFVKAVKTAISRIWSSGFELRSQALAVMVLGKLPKTLESFVWAVTHRYQKLEVEEVIQKLEKEDLQFRSGQSEEKKAVAFTSEATSPDTRTHYVYNKVGHIARDCQSQQGGNQGYQFQKEPSNGNMAEQSEEEDSIALVTISETNKHALFETEKTKDWIVDSGASEHRFTDREDFMYHRKQTGRVQVGEGNPKINIVGGGDLVRYHKGRQIIFKEFLHIPKLTYNLISLNSLCENNTSLGKKSNTTF